MQIYGVRSTIAILEQFMMCIVRSMSSVVMERIEEKVLFIYVGGDVRDPLPIGKAEYLNSTSLHRPVCSLDLYEQHAHDPLFTSFASLRIAGFFLILTTDNDFSSRERPR